MAESPYEASFEGLHSWGSQAHCYGMFPAYFLSSYVLGVRLDGSAQKKTLLIEPRLGDLTEAAGTVVTEFGPVTISWKQAGEQWNYAVDTSHLLAGTIVHLRLPVGTEKFSVKLDEAWVKPGARKVKQLGRWLDVPLTLGQHQGFWKSSAN